MADRRSSSIDPKTQRRLKYLVDRGGTVILIAGDQAMPQAFLGMPLADILPVNAGEALDPCAGVRFGPFRRGSSESVNAACRSARFDRTTSGRK